MLDLQMTVSRCKECFAQAPVSHLVTDSSENLDTASLDWTMLNLQSCLRQPVPKQGHTVPNL